MSPNVIFLLIVIVVLGGVMVITGITLLYRLMNAIHDKIMVVFAHCDSCGNEHRVGDRNFEGGMATECPACNDTSYHSIADGGKVDVSERDRIVNTVMPINGVGDETAINIASHFDLYAELEAASIDELKSIDGVGQLVAQRIQDRV